MSETERNLEPFLPIIHYSYLCGLSIVTSCLGPPDLAPVSFFHFCVSKLVLHLCVPSTALTVTPPAGYNIQSMLQIRSLSCVTPPAGYNTQSMLQIRTLSCVTPPAGYNTQSMLQIQSLSCSPPSLSRSWDPGHLFRCTAPPQAAHLPSSPGTWTENCLQRRAWATDTQSGSMLIRPVTSSATWT